MDDRNAQLIYGLLVLMLVASSLFSRRLSWRMALPMVAGWIGLFTLVFALVTYRRELSGVFERMRGELTGASAQRVEGRTVRIQRSDDGHYWAQAMINDRSIHLLIDSGASFTALSQDTADAVGVKPSSNPMPIMIETANGTVMAQRASIDRLTIGPLATRDLNAVVSPAFGRTDVIGMNFLSRLKSWRVENGEMILEP